MAQRELRDVVRYRKRLIEARAREATRVLKVLETADIKLGSVVTNGLGVTARAMLKALIAGAGASDELEERAQGSLRRKRPARAEALTGRVTAHHRFLPAQLLRHIEFLDDAIATCDGRSATRTRRSRRRFETIHTLRYLCLHRAGVIVRPDVYATLDAGSTPAVADRFTRLDRLLAA
jgi:transposase